MYAVRRDRKLATSVDSGLSRQTKHPAHDTALQQGAVVAEHEVEGASNRHAQSPVGRDAIIDRLDVGLDLSARRVGLPAVVAEEKHERLREPVSKHAAVRSAVDVDAGLAPGILVAELQGHGPTQRVTEYAHARHIDASGEPS